MGGEIYRGNLKRSSLLFRDKLHLAHAIDAPGSRLAIFGPRVMTRTYLVDGKQTLQSKQTNLLLIESLGRYVASTIDDKKTELTPIIASQAILRTKTLFAKGNYADKYELPNKTQKKPEKHPWFSGEHRGMRTEMLDQRRKYQHTKDPHDAGLYCLLRGAYHRALKAAENVYNNEKLNSLLESARGGISALYSLFRKSPHSNVVDTEVFYEHCQALFNNEQVEEPKTIPTCQPLHHPLLAHFTAEEIEGTISKFRSKATSTIGISPYALKLMVNQISPHLAYIFNKCLTTVKFPLEWLESKVFFIHKKGPTNNPNNFRSIAIQNPFLKTFVSQNASQISSKKITSSLLFNSASESSGLLLGLQRSCSKQLIHALKQNLSLKKRLLAS